MICGEVVSKLSRDNISINELIKCELTPRISQHDDYKHTSDLLQSVWLCEM